MTRTTVILIIFSLLPNLSYSQEKDSIAPKLMTFTTNVTDYIPSIKLNTANINIGIEVYLKNRKSLAFNLGIVKSYGPSSGLFSISSENTIGFKGQFEGRHYLNKHKLFIPAILVFWPHLFQFNTQELDNTGYYVAIHSSFQATATDRQEKIVDYIDDYPFPIYKKNIYTVHRNGLTVNFKFGYQCIKKSGLTVDYAVGLGGQYISSSSTDKQGADTGSPNSQKEIWGKEFDEGAGFYPNIVYEIRVGWRL